MAFLIENNAFTRDTYGVRSTRLQFLSSSIDTYAVELGITGDLLEWAQDAFENFELARTNQSVELGEKDEAFQTSQEADLALGERFQVLKDILISRYPVGDDLLKVYGIFQPSPVLHDETIHAAEDLISGHNKRKDEGDPNVLPDAMITNLQVLIDNSRSMYYQAGLERTQSQLATISLQTIFTNDSKKLRAVYNWVIATWSKSDPRLISLGFVQASDQTGGDTLPAPFNLVYHPEIPSITWDPVEGATSYQVVLKPIGGLDWLEIYNGVDTDLYHADPVGTYLVKARARNANGYGDWSAELQYTIEIQGPDI